MRRLNAAFVAVFSITAAGSLRAAMAQVLIGLLPAISLASTRSWDGAGGEDTGWTTGANWSSNTQPGISDTAEFDRGAALDYTVTFPFLFPFPGDITTNQLIVGSNAVTFEPDRSNTNYIVAEQLTREIGRGVIIGEEFNDTAAALTSHLKLFSTAAATLGHVAGSSGTLILNQNDDQFHVTGSSIVDTELIIGRYGTGVLSISGGADADVNNYSGNVSLAEYKGSSGTASISGAGSTFITDHLVVGNAGNGTLNVTTGGFVENVFGIIGNLADSTGTANVSGSGSTWSNGGLLVGEFGHGHLNITGGGVFESDGARIADQAGSVSTATVSGAGSTFIAGPGLVVGNAGNGTFGVTGGGEVRSSSVFIASSTVGSTGEVTIDGSGSIWTSTSAFFVGSGGHGTLNVTGGGQLDTSDNSGLIGYSAGSEGAATVDGMGSTWTTRHLYVGWNDGDGSLTVTNGGTVQGLALLVGNNGEIHGDGNLVLNVQNSGLVSPGTSAAALNIDGNYTQSASGQLLIELASPSSYDQLLVTGTATLAGTLTVNLMEGFAPSIGQTFTVLTADVVNGTFTTETLPSVPNLSFDVTYNAHSVVVSISSALPGDFDGDGTVGAADFVAWRNNDGTPQEYTTWRANFGATAAGAAAVAHSGATAGLPSSAAVPEPATLVLILLAAGLSLIVRERRWILNRTLRLFWEV